jgi:hypothetical protein
MKFNCGSKSVWLPMVLVGGLAVVLVPSFLPASKAPELPTSTSPRGIPPRTSEPIPPLPPSPPELPSDPILRQWKQAIRQHDAKGVLNAQSAFHAREEDYREPLARLAKDDPEERVRAFSISVLGQLKSPPSEEFFVDRLADPSEYPRTSALNALERLGSASCLPAVERAASTDTAEGVRAAAARAAKAVRSR